MKVYQKINDYLTSNGIKQKFLSEKSKIPENTLSMILNGKRKLEADEFIEIVNVLNLDANYFINKSNSENGG